MKECHLDLRKNDLISGKAYVSDARRVQWIAMVARVAPKNGDQGGLELANAFGVAVRDMDVLNGHLFVSALAAPQRRPSRMTSPGIS
jgi:hypothetical protein